MNLLKNKKGQVTIFVILALVIVAAIVIFFAFRSTVTTELVSPEFKPIYDKFASCIQDETRAALDIAGSQGGYVDAGTYVPGSDYAPFSSHLNFLGFPVPYWYYVTANGMIKENVPDKTSVEKQIADYIASRVNDCNFEEFYAQGFSINYSSADVKVTLSPNSVSVEVDDHLAASKEASSAIKSKHVVSVDSAFGRLYDSALKIYNKEKKDAFLENYSADVLRLYAPVDGVETGCSGKIWKTREVVDGLKSAFEANVAAIRFKGNYYSGADKYFVVNEPVTDAVNMIYSKAWPSKIEITGADDELMVAEPIGTQRGLGTMGFCYSPYHFIYDISYPVLIQVYSGNELFQFPVVVVIDKNLPRKGLFSVVSEQNATFDLCQFKTQDLSVNVYDAQLKKVDADLSYECFNQRCSLGTTSNGVFSGKAPACVNGYLWAKAEGYTTNTQLLSTNRENSKDVILDRERELSVELDVGSAKLDGTAIVIFNSPDRSATAALPGTDKIKLSEGLYNVTVYVYGNSSLTIPASTKRQCTETLAGGIIGFFGVTTEKCFDINIPETKIESALIGGGTGTVYVLDSDLDKSKVKVSVDRLKTPTSIDELTNNFILFESKGAEVKFE